MTFRQFAFNNVARNKRLYAAYFLSSMFTVMAFFTFAVFAFHPALNGEGMNRNVTQGMNIAAGIIYTFSFFFILYSMSSFLQSRKKELGVLMLHGMTKRQVRSMVFLENMIIGFCATLGGIVLGVVFAKAMLLLAENVLVLENGLNFYIPVHAAVLTFVSFIVLFFLISLFVSYVLRSGKLIDLIKGEKASKGEPKANIALTVIAAVLLGGGYATALVAKGLVVVAVMLPVVVMVIVGTYLLFTQLSVFAVRRLKKSESLFWRRTNMILFSDLSYRMKDNARTFFLVAIISTVAFSAIGTLYGFQTLLTEGVRAANPYTFTSYADERENIALIEKTLQEEKIEAKAANAVLRYYKGDTTNKIAILTQSDFNRLADLIGEDAIEAKDGQAVVVKLKGSPFPRGTEPNATIPLQSGAVLHANEVRYSRALPAMDSYYIVSDKNFDELPAPIDEESFHAWLATGGTQNIFAASKKMYEALPHQVTAVEYEIYRIHKDYGAILFVGLFIGVVFFVSAGSFLYFRLYMDVDGDKRKFKTIARMGLSEKELKQVLNRQTAILVFAPIVVALVHGAVALTSLSRLFSYDLTKQSAMVLGVFLAIQILYFFVLRFFYTKQIKAAIPT
ncbi:ABC transporter permease [Paenibacillus flagellatus]|uniref:ABC transporter permease n=1 Tax=Paenibacillus flagellatus TaxID=2211139 RepID=A0A2V5JWY3_9BACL|nr:ABC transporter permease [Paenibacillus flagellatus]PYI51335.1 ABC transporter permease [Paenibacillus flagellatus]